MAQKIHVTLVDDLDQSPADENVTFGLDGISYEIDLSAKNAGELREALAKYIGAGRRAGGRAVRGRGTATAAPKSKSDVAEIRTWAKDNGYEVHERGRIQAEIRNAYYAAQGA
ncbi:MULTISPECIES: Lsr2 family protein [unclassified Arthrobacter]|uniref:histone-like nucleoid-structuring protein Lsr2 n=1 Tax=unclassified Arthrobacter TaxID=235627 RepID=UPI00159DA197|nr:MULTISPECIES: Lsr2 family protein [unclassified Arthrobacter]MCQ9162589.1 Lsr2 family protein [Arthrobacter sp. STN4]NVM98383.1 Lsr2 family protein [Arthrobacter sp. SDTb3-6]